jgi:hypothetical protein
MAKFKVFGQLVRSNGELYPKAMITIESCSQCGHLIFETEATYNNKLTYCRECWNRSCDTRRAIDEVNRNRER